MTPLPGHKKTPVDQACRGFLFLPEGSLFGNLPNIANSSGWSYISFVGEIDLVHIESVAAYGRSLCNNITGMVTNNTQAHVSRVQCFESDNCRQEVLHIESISEYGGLC